MLWNGTEIPMRNALRGEPHLQTAVCKHLVEL